MPMNCWCATRTQGCPLKNTRRMVMTEPASRDNHTGDDFEGVVVGRVLTCEDHPSADHLHVCSVDARTRRCKSRCGAAHVRAGMPVPVALEGARLPGVIKKEERRGVLRHDLLRPGADSPACTPMRATRAFLVIEKDDVSPGVCAFGRCSAWATTWSILKFWPIGRTLSVFGDCPRKRGGLDIYRLMPEISVEEGRESKRWRRWRFSTPSCAPRRACAASTLFALPK